MRNVIRNIAFAATVTLTGSITAATAAVVNPIVENGSFELNAGSGFYGNSFADLLTPNTTNWDVFASVPGWVTSGDGLEHQTQPTLGLSPLDGAYYVELASNEPTSITQTLTLAAGKYVLSFLYAARDSSDGDTNAIDWALTQAGTIARGLLAPIVAGVAVAEGPDRQWRKIEAAFTILDAGQYDLSFTATGTKPKVGGLLDAVQVTPSAVPVPAAGLMLLGALGGLAALRRRKPA